MTHYLDNKHPVTPGIHDACTEPTRRTLARYGLLDRTGISLMFQESIGSNNNVKQVWRVYSTYGPDRTLVPEPWVFTCPYDVLVEHGPHLRGSEQDCERWTASARTNLDFKFEYLQRLRDETSQLDMAQERVGYWARRLFAAEPESLQWAKTRLSLEAARKWETRMRTDAQHCANNLDRAETALVAAQERLDDSIQIEARMMVAQQALGVRCVTTDPKQQSPVYEPYNWNAPKVVDLMAALERSLTKAKADNK